MSTPSLLSNQILINDCFISPEIKINDMIYEERRRPLQEKFNVSSESVPN